MYSDLLDRQHFFINNLVNWSVNDFSESGNYSNKGSLEDFSILVQYTFLKITIMGIFDGVPTVRVH